MKLIPSKVIEKLINMTTAIDLMEFAFTLIYNQKCITPARIVSHFSEINGNILSMPIFIPELNCIGIKVLNYFPDNKKKGKPPITGVILYSDSNSGEMKYILDAEYITKLRTGAATGVATKYLSNKDSKSLGIIGAGIHSFHQVQAVLEVREIEKLLIYDLDKKQSKKLAKCFQNKNIDIVIHEDPNSLVSESDILITCTTGTTPVFDGKFLKKGTHINAVGTFKSEDRELDDITLKRSSIFTDDIVAETAGDILIPMEKKIITKENIKGSLGDVINSKVNRTSTDEITLFKSVGLAIQDIVVANEVIKKYE